MEKFTDAELIALYRQGTNDALATLIRRHLPSVYRFLYRMTGDASLAEDLAQETFVKAWKHLSRFDATKQFRTWVFSIAKHSAIDALRKKNPIPFSTLESEDMPDMASAIPDEQPLPPELLERAETARDLERALAGLPPNARSVVLLHETEDMTFQEIADATGEPMNTVKSRYRRALSTLQKALHDRWNGETHQM